MLGCTYDWTGFGLKLHIPQGSLPANCQRCTVDIRASLSGQYTFPADSELVSGVYWIHCPVQLSRPAMLEIQHSKQCTEGLNFVRANCTLEQLPYSFQRQEGGMFSKHSYYGSIHLTRFSGWAIIHWLMCCTAPQPDREMYIAQVCYADTALNMWQVVFAIRCRRGLSLDLEDRVYKCSYVCVVV